MPSTPVVAIIAWVHKAYGEETLACPAGCRKLIEIVKDRYSTLNCAGGSYTVL
jgi:hypothetical protein